MKDELLNPKQVSDLLQIGVIQLAKWRMFGRGPRFVKMGDAGKKHVPVRYRRSDIEAWLQANTVETRGAA